MTAQIQQFRILGKEEENRVKHEILRKLKHAFRELAFKPKP